jgi:rubrerythrin
MIAQRQTGTTPAGMNEEAMIQAVMALLNLRHPVGVSRWDCDICGMIHTAHEPLVCESCGGTSLSHQSVQHREMNNHW